MAAKEEHARNLEMHKMKKNNNETAKKNAELESECAKLKIMLKDATDRKTAELEAECAKLKIMLKDAMDRHATAHDALTQQHSVRINELQSQLENEKKQLKEKMQKDMASHRSRQLDEINNIKQELETVYSDKMNELKAIHDASMQQLSKDKMQVNEEREALHRDAEEQVAQIKQERGQVKRELEDARQQIKQEFDDFHERIAQDEHSQTIRLALELDSERKKMKCQLEDERKVMNEQMEEADIEKRKKWEEEMEELKKTFEAEHKESILKLESETEQCNKERESLKRIEADLHAQHDEWDKKIKKKEEEQTAWQHEQNEQIQKRERELNEHLQKKEHEMNEHLQTREHELNEQNQKREQAQIAFKNELLNEYKKKEEDLIAKFNYETNRLKQKEEEQHSRFVNEVKMIEDERNRMKQQILNEQMQMKQEYAQMKQQLNDEFEHIRRDERKQQVQFLTHMKIEREKMNAQLEFERQKMYAHDMETLAKASHDLEIKFNARVAENAAAHNAGMQQLNKEREQVEQMQEVLVNKKKQWDLEYNKIKELQLGIRLEKEQVAENARKDAEAMRTSNEEILAQQKEHNDAKLNAAIGQVNKQRDELKQYELAREKEYAERVKQNDEKLVKATREMETKLQSTMDKLNQERQQIKKRLEEEQERNKLAELEQEKLKTMKAHVEQTRVLLFEQAQKDAAAQRKSNEDALSDAMKQLKVEQDAKFNAIVREHVQKMNEERELLKRHEANLNVSFSKKVEELQHELAEQKTKLVARLTKENEAVQNANAKLIAEHKKELDYRVSVAMHDINERKIAYDEEIKRMKEEIEAQTKLNDEMVNVKKKELDARFETTMKERRIAFEESVKNLNIEKENHKTKVQAEYEELLNKHKAEIDARMTSMMNERNNSFAQAIQNLNDERAQQKLKLEAENNAVLARYKMEHESKMKIMNQEWEQSNKKFNEQWIKLNEFKKENEAAIEKARNEVSLEKLSNEKKLETALKTMQILNQKSAHLDSEMEKLRTAQEDLAKKRDMLFEEKTRVGEIQTRLEADRKICEEERKILEQERITFTSECNPHKYKSGLIKSLMDEIDQLNNNYTEEREKMMHNNNSLRQQLENSSENLQEIIASNLAHLQLINSLDFKNKRIAIYSHYSDSSEVESYNFLTIESIQHYFDYVFVLTNCPNKWNMGSLNHNKIYLLAYNMKSDFRNFGVFIMQTKDALINASCMCLLNDSFVVVDVNAFGRCMKHLFETHLTKYDFIGLTSSYECTFHMQSYFLCLNASIMQSVLNYFNKIGLPDNHGAAISKYEIGLSTHLVNEGFSHFSFVSNNEMQHPLNTTCCKWSEVLNETGIIKRQHFFKKYAYKSMSDNDISDVAEKYSYNKHFMHFLNYHQIKLISPSK